MEEFLELRPHAQVILSIRKSASEWKKSVAETIGIIMEPLLLPPFSFSPFFQGFAGQLDPWLWERTNIVPLGTMDKIHGESVMTYQDNMEDAYLQWIEYVKTTVPEGQLLIHHASDGYGPICKALSISDQDCPQESYPHIGDTKELKQLIATFHAINKAFYVVVTLLILGLLVWLKRKMTGTTTTAPPPSKKKDS